MRVLRLAATLLLPVLFLPLTAVPAMAEAASPARTSATATGPAVLVSGLSGTCPDTRPGAARGEVQVICLDIAFTPTGIPAGETRTLTVQLLGHVFNGADGTIGVFNPSFQTFTMDSSANGILQRPSVGCTDVFGAVAVDLSHHEFRVVPGPGIALAAGSIVTSASFECPGSGGAGIPPTEPVILAGTGGFDLRYVAAGLALIAAGLALLLLGRRRRPDRERLGHGNAGHRGSG